MTWSPRTVLIPLAASGALEGRIARIQADAQQPAHDEAGLNPQISELGDWGLYEAGAIALGAIRRVRLRPRGPALAFWVQRGRAYGHLSATNGPDLRGLTPENARSAELGLALGLVMHAGQSKEQMAIATGSLARSTGANAAALDEVAVEPVGGLGSKFTALTRSLDAQKGSAYARRVRFILPAKTLSGEPTTLVHADALQRLQHSFRERGVELDITPVHNFREALVRLGIDRLKPTPADRAALFGATAAFAALVAAFLLYRWLTAPLDISFASIRLAAGDEVPSPARAIFDAREGIFRTIEGCFGEQRLPVYRIGESLAFRAVLRSPSAIVRALGGYHFAVVGVSEQSGLKVYPAETFREIGPAGKQGQPTEAKDFDMSAVVPIIGPQEKSKLIILVRRLRAFDTRALHEQLTAAIADKRPSERINTVVTRLGGTTPGYIDYSFRSVEDQGECDTK